MWPRKTCFLITTLHLSASINCVAQFCEINKMQCVTNTLWSHVSFAMQMFDSPVSQPWFLKTMIKQLVHEMQNSRINIAAFCMQTTWVLASHFVEMLLLNGPARWLTFCFVQCKKLEQLARQTGPSCSHLPMPAPTLASWRLHKGVPNNFYHMLSLWIVSSCWLNH